MTVPVELQLSLKVPYNQPQTTGHEKTEDKLKKNKGVRKDFPHKEVLYKKTDFNKYNQKMTLVIEL